MADLRGKPSHLAEISRNVLVEETVRGFVPLEIIGPKSLGIVLWGRINLGINIDDVDVA